MLTYEDLTTAVRDRMKDEAMRESLEVLKAVGYLTFTSAFSGPYQIELRDPAIVGQFRDGYTKSRAAVVAAIKAGERNLWQLSDETTTPAMAGLVVRQFESEGAITRQGARFFQPTAIFARLTEPEGA